MIKTYWLLHRLLLLQRGRQENPAPQQQGLSLLECLVAMLIISLVMIAVTPAIFLVTATRVQNRRAEQAMQLAQAEIDRVRTLVERGDYTLADLPADIGTNINGAPLPSAIFDQVKSAAACRTYTGGTVPAASLLPVDAYRPPSAFGTPLQPGEEQDNCTPEFLIQTFRTTGVIPTGGSVPTGFQMGVRVYSDNSFLRGNLGRLKNDENQQQAPSLKMASGLGSQGSRPLSVLYSTIVRNDTNQRALQDYRTLCSANGRC